MTEARCGRVHDVAGFVIRCEREHGHGGAHRAEIDDAEYDPDYTYVVSWWPHDTAAAGVAADTEETK